MNTCFNCLKQLSEIMPTQLCADCFEKAYKYATSERLLECVEPLDSDGNPTECYLIVDPPILLTEEQYALAIPTWDEETRVCRIQAKIG